MSNDFWKRAEQEKRKIDFKSTWLNKVQENAKITQMKSRSDKFQTLLNVPVVISDPKFVNRRKTFEVFTKNKQLDLYLHHLKKAQSSTISKKATYQEVIQQTQNSKMQSQFTSSYKKNLAGIHNNTLWSDKYQNMISNMSRLRELTQILEQNKMKSKEELLLEWEQYFSKKTNIPRQAKSVNDLVTDMKYAFGGEWNPRQQQQQSKPEINMENYQTTRCTTSHLHTTSSSQRIFASQQGKRNITERSYKFKAKEKLQFILQNAVETQNEAKQIIQEIDEFKQANYDTSKQKIIERNKRIKQESIIQALKNLK
ncbi:hypothetical protein pb186bvf_017862 [Paramecium bursaria]